MPSVESSQRGKAAAIDVDQSTREKAGDARNIVHNHAHMALLAHARFHEPYLGTPVT
jgi:hypothetical protein